MEVLAAGVVVVAGGGGISPAASGTERTDKQGQP